MFPVKDAPVCRFYEAQGALFACAGVLDEQEVLEDRRAR